MGECSGGCLGGGGGLLGAGAGGLSTIGLMVLVVVFFGGFIVIGGEWFQKWKSTEWNGLEPAFRNSVLALIGLVTVHLPAAEWERR